MKIREALVSNSSSSSYFFNVKELKFNDFVDGMVCNYYFCYFNRGDLNNEIKDNLKKAIKDNQNRNKTYLKGSKGLSKILSKMHKDAVLSCKKDLADLNKCSTNKELVEFVLRYRGIKTNITKEGVEFSSFTAMHNDFNEGMEDLMKEIIMYFCFDTNYKTEFRREDDDYKNPKNTKKEDVGVLKEKFLKEIKK